MKKRLLALILTLSMIVPMFSVGTRAAEEETPLLTIACLSDLHNQNSLLTSNPPRLRPDIGQTLTAMKNEEDKVDAVLIGGDVTSDNYVPQANVHAILDQLKSYTDPLTNNVFMVSGNHDYNAGYGAGYNSADYYDYIMKNQVGELSGDDVYYETHFNEQYVMGFHYTVNGFDFVGINPSPTDLKKDQNYYYCYTDGTFDWLKAKLAKIGKDKRIFLLAHLPIAGSNSLNQGKGMLDDSTQKMLRICTQYPNLVYLYGHDHGGDSAYIYNDTAERVTEYDSDGNIIGGGRKIENISEITDALVWRFTASDGGYTVQNLENNMYLGITTNLNPVDTPYVWKIKSTDGKFVFQSAATNQYITYSNGSKGYSVYTSSADIDLYKKVTDGENVRYVGASEIVDGGEYIIVTNTNRAMQNKVMQSNRERMAAADIAVKTSPDASAVFTVKKAGMNYRFASGDGKYLGYSGNLFAQPLADYSSDNDTLWTVNNGSVSGRFTLDNASKDGLHYGSSGWSLGSRTDTMIYRLDKQSGAWYAINSASELSDGDSVMLQDLSSQKILTAQSNGSSGNDRRLNPIGLSAVGGDLVAVPQISGDDGQEESAAVKSFTSSFVGSMRYYNNSINGSVGDGNPDIVQALLIYVYSDRIVLQMKNYGNKDGGSRVLSPYTIKLRTQSAPPVFDSNVTGGKSTPTFGKVGTKITLKANTPSYGKGFEKWTGLDGVVFADGYNEQSNPTVFEMPNHDIDAKVQYKDVEVDPSGVAIYDTIDVDTKVASGDQFYNYMFTDVKPGVYKFAYYFSGVTPHDNNSQMRISPKVRGNGVGEHRCWVDFRYTSVIKQNIKDYGLSNKIIVVAVVNVPDGYDTVLPGVFFESGLGGTLDKISLASPYYDFANDTEYDWCAEKSNIKDFNEDSGGLLKVDDNAWMLSTRKDPSQLSSNAELASVTVDGVAAKIDGTNITVEVPKAASHKVTATAADAKAKIDIADDLKKITVTAEDGTKKVYTLTITEKGPTICPPYPTPSVPKNGTKIVNGKTVLYQNSKAVSGTKVVTVGGKTYAVVKGYVKTGTKTQLVKIGKKTYAVDKSGVVVKTKANKLIKIGSKTYVLSKNGTIIKGAKNKLVKVGKKSYIVDKKGVVLKNKKSVKVGKKVYKTNKKGVATLAKKK